MVEMTSKRKPLQYYLLDRAKKRPSIFATLHPQVISTKKQIDRLVCSESKNSVWISYSSHLTEALVKNISSGKPSLGLGLFLHSLDMNIIPALTSCFRRIAFETEGGFLPAEELVEVLESENRSHLFIGGSVDKTTKTITFWRGDVKSLTLPFSTFETTGSGTTPDFSQFSITDYGQTVQLGKYEAAVDAILYEYDPQYRRQIAKQRLQKDQSFGASVRRLRKQRGLKREDFEPDLSAKTIARIEQGKTTRIHKKTLNFLAKHLSVQPQEISSF